LHSLDLNLKDLDIRLSTSKLKDDEDIISSLTSTAGAKQLAINQSLQPATTTSSRKSSFSEYGYSTPPTNISSYLSSRTIIQERDTSFTDDQTYNIGVNDLILNRNHNSASFSIATTQNILKSSSNALTAHEFLKKNPKCFGAKFSGLPGN
jgi:hypothetical protein